MPRMRQFLDHNRAAAAVVLEEAVLICYEILELQISVVVTVEAFWNG